MSPISATLAVIVYVPSPVSVTLEDQSCADQSASAYPRVAVIATSDASSDDSSELSSDDSSVDSVVAAASTTSVIELPPSPVRVAVEPSVPVPV